MSTPSALVTGGAGFIGSQVGELFSDRGFAVRILDDLWQRLRDSSAGLGRRVGSGSP